MTTCFYKVKYLVNGEEHEWRTNGNDWVGVSDACYYEHCDEGKYEEITVLDFPDMIGVNDLEGLKKDIREEIIYASLVYGENTIHWAVEPNGNWYKWTSVDGNEHLRNSEDVEVYDIEQIRYYRESDNPELNGSGTERIWMLYDMGALEDAYPDEDWEGWFDSLSDYELTELEEWVVQL